MELGTLGIKDIQEGLQKKTFSATELAEASFSAIREKDPKIHAFLEVTENLALEQAAAVDKKVANKEKLGALAGVPSALKDAILVKGVRATAGSRMLENYTAPYDATVVEKLKGADALLVGKTNMDEFGMGASTENSAFGVTRNPLDEERVPGGSSGGSAASVAAGEAVIALGEDTGGSIRLPASFCGLVGLKPTYGAVSRNGIIALASSLDQVGPFARTVEDCEIVFDVIRGKDPLDATSVDAQVQDPNFKIQNLRIGVPKEYFGEGLDPVVGDVIKNTLKKLEDAGAKLVEVSIPHVQYALAAYYIINTSEASANLARYDGIRYGFSKAGNTLLETYLESRGEAFGTEVKRRIMLGTYALSAGYYDAYYIKAQKVRTLLKQDFEKAFEEVDVIAGPVSPFLPFKIGEKMQDPLAMYLVDIYTVSANLTALPSLSVPAGKAENLPVGLQLMAPAFQENLLFKAGSVVEALK
ncbi:MAG: glutaminyl-tRNA synthase (glutamine-hydrolyzing) subunit A [Candidatus Wildermuthbacteria bacterium RIFCSPHIGHO2_01_FULL_48_25]|uniref:Glutamyl-tRNA(Gln) amidotransferase subunit A n=1 Tax=Candidatus Wildermuthbacteria bacterium RIFCSPLOWO2_01_FULL_48_16 TaxID=1802461 RepID=A0A1G2RKQ8_9BACT|nr:MAG: glutaminyl-tRNA synthase (glutamine-hydrolyzing) subunit A [Candidatus Wildermuthbacteria bacterium RIFCSPHIGHO2_01_FULL_48_25]OHA73430.1 MAG: glutaminyl-tRNA synthase (glutamine-hydrolyzing) subunit A [Candidatus Wildermuthbacteria bacterium RIFCSPLOWO2_01_FULL_48_16]